MIGFALLIAQQTDTRLGFRGELSSTAGILLAVTCAVVVAAMYMRETRVLAGAAKWTLPVLRAAAVMLVILMLVGPVLTHRREEGTRGVVTFVIDPSASMQTRDGDTPDSRQTQVRKWLGLPENLDAGPLQANPQTATTSAQPVSRELSGESFTPGLLQELSTTHRLRLITPPGPTQQTDLARLLLAAGSVNESSTADARPNEARQNEPGPMRTVVLLSDGQNNRGDSPLDTAEKLQRTGITIATVGVGETVEPPTLAILEVRHPDRVDVDSEVRGFLRYKRILPSPVAVPVRILDQEDRVVWEGEVAANDPDLGRVSFSFPAKTLADFPAAPNDLASARRAQRGQRLVTLRAELSFPSQFDIETASTDTGTSPLTNNPLRQRDFALAIDSATYRMLIFDGRSRWETRYLRNLFERDPRWSVNTVLVGPGTSLPDQIPRGDEDGQIPNVPQQWLDYDLVFLGEVPPALLTTELQQTLATYVEQGGALIMIDGSRHHLASVQDGPLGELTPVRWLAGAGRVDGLRVDGAGQTGVFCEQIRPTASGENTPWLVLEGSEAARRFAGEVPRDWNQLPAPHHLNTTLPKADAEVLLEAGIGATQFPLLVHRMFGGGQVVFLATDETWRWRRGVADLVHARFWNQVALGVMRPPMAVENDAGAFDAGSPRSIAGEPIPLRAQLRRPDGSLAADQQVSVEILREGEVVQSVTLTPDGRVPGLYRAQATGLPPGRYRTRLSAVGYGDALAPLQTQLTVVPPPTEEWTRVALDESRLQQIADAGQGIYVSMADRQTLLNYLKPRTQGRIIESTTSLWDSYFWFVPLVLLLSLEWWIRKRVGLP